MLQTGGLDAEDLLHLERFGYEPKRKARKRSSKVPATALELTRASFARTATISACCRLSHGRACHRFRLTLQSSL